MLSLYPFAPSLLSDPIFHSPFDMMDEAFVSPITTRRYVLPRRRYVYRHSPYDIDALIDHMAELTSLDDHDVASTDAEGKSRRRSRSRSNSPRLSPRRTPANTESKSEEKYDTNMTPAENKETEVKTAEPSTSSTAATSSVPVSDPAAASNTSTTSAASPTPSASPSTNVATTEAATAPSTTDKTTSNVSPFRLIKQLNGLQLTLTSSDTAYTITTPVPPSISKSDLQLAVDNNVLTLSAQIHSAQKNANGKTESSSRVLINRSIRLNRDANTEGINAHFNDGNLTITVPRIPEKKQTINIQ